MDATKKPICMSNAKRRQSSPFTSRLKKTEPKPGYIYNSKVATRPSTVPGIIGFTPRLSHRKHANTRGSNCYVASTQVVDFQRLLVELKCKIIRTRKSLLARPVTTISTQSYEAMFSRFRSNQRARNGHRNSLPIHHALAYPNLSTLISPISIFNTLPH
jgi:hypothetical protein